jgi:hypothetical protein
MWSFTFKNLRTRPARTALGLIGLAIPILGVLGLYNATCGLRALAADTPGQIQNVMAVRENVPMPVFSILPADMAERLRRVPGVLAVAPELSKIAPHIEGMGLIQYLSRNLGPKTGPLRDRQVSTRSRFGVLLLMSRSPRRRH